MNIKLPFLHRGVFVTCDVARMTRRHDGLLALDIILICCVASEPRLQILCNPRRQLFGLLQLRET